MPIRQFIDGKKNDIRVLCTGPSDSDDAGLVEGVPIDPPDDSSGWELADLWVEHDTVQEKGEKGTITSRNVNPVFYQVWSKPKTKAKVKRKKKKSVKEVLAAAARNLKAPSDIQAIKDETAAAVTPQPTPEKPKRGRPKKKPRPRAEAAAPEPPIPSEEAPPVN